MQHDLDDEEVRIAVIELINLCITTARSVNTCPACVLTLMQQILDQLPDQVFEQLHQGTIVKIELKENEIANDDFETVGGPQ